MQINTKKYEINKSSDLCQVVFFTRSRKKDPELFNITALQLDLMNAIFYQTNKYLIQNKINIEDSEATLVQLSISELTSMLKKYKKSGFEYIIDSLDKLTDVKVLINALNKNKNIQEIHFTRFILKITISKHLDNRKKMIRILMDNEVIKRINDIKSLFCKMFLSIQFSMTSKYSKLLYELLKDYVKINTLTLNIDYCLEILNVTETKMQTWSNFRPHVLEKAIKEINEKSDIKVSYEPIKEKLPGQRKQVTKIKFNMKKQSNTHLKKLGLIEEPITSLPFYNKSKAKLDNLVKNGYKVIDEDMWIETDIKKNEDRYDAEVLIDKWLKETDQEDRNDIYKILAESLDDCDDPMVVIEDYKLIGLFSKDAFTKNPNETIEKLNWIIEEMNNYVEGDV